MTLLNHIGEHLEEISLFVLPLNLSDGDEADADSQNSKNARRQESVVNASQAFSGSLRGQDNSPVWRAQFDRGLPKIRTDVPILEPRDDKAPGGFGNRSTTSNSRLLR
jgi:hypothetical protein